MHTLPLKAITLSFLLLGLMSCSNNKVETQAEAPKKDTSAAEVPEVKSYVLLNVLITRCGYAVIHKGRVR